MRLYESLSYSHNNDNNSNNIHTSDKNIDRGCNSNENTSGNTVKTFTTNGNHQSNIDCVTVTSATPKKSTVTCSFFEQNESQHWLLESELTKALSALNETDYFYGSQQKLKTRENLETNLNDDDDCANGNVIKRIEANSKDCVDLINESSLDYEAEINRLINRSNLCRQNYECESHKITATETEEQLMDEEGTLFSFFP